MRGKSWIAAVGMALAHGACSSSSKTVLTSGDAGGTGGQDAASDASVDASGGGDGQAGGASGGTGGTAISYMNMVLSDGPSLYWRELAGTGSVADVSPKGNNGNYAGCVEPGAMSAGPTFRLCGGYLYAADIFDFAGRAPFTLEAWIKPERVQRARFARIAGKENPVVGRRQGWDLIAIGWEEDGGTPTLNFERWVVADGPEISPGADLINPTIPSTGFTHLAVTYDGTKSRIYLNGVSLAEGQSTASIADTTGAFTVGADPFGGNNWLAEIDEVAVYEKALLADRVAAHYDRGKVDGY